MSELVSALHLGMPVYNGERYLEEVLDSILAQTYGNFTLIISDNASTDRTEEICRKYVAKDKRIRYFRQSKNIGAPSNFNRVFSLSSAKYFKWATADDIISPQYLEKCVKVLDQDDSVVLCHTISGRINEKGQFIGVFDKDQMKKIGAEKPHERFGDLLSLFPSALPLLGVARRSVFDKSQLLGSYVGADRNLLAEVSLMGKIFLVPECLFYFREHPGSYTTKYYVKDRSTSLEKSRVEMAWWSTEKWAGFSHWKTCWEYFKSVRNRHLQPIEKLLCYDQILRWILHEGWFFLWNDVELFLLRRSKVAQKTIPKIRSNLIHI